MKNREVLESMNKEDLIELIIQYGDNGLFPIELFTLKAEYDFSYDDLAKCWQEILRKALMMDQDEDGNAAEVLATGAELLFEQIKRIDAEEVNLLLETMIENLERAAEEDGIGMHEDSEWMYLQVKDDIEEYCGEI
ncbi:hypothetical protein SAMN02910384_01757 [Pseudobutyrivibrio sp. ACV-2]|uniref:hypothetical protein n=1 Tax=Pseudobutyrivibrio sp. ACV-2 TaxID=1520801 RepID=UPI0008961167|nr:hypothetical protein [Pseudobutyrivibrio sp. ACV-2]SEA55948.1 hypothetical protein SAMN02910384_01757 [Pseudobutyrivibrio sp. ACV-2]